MLDWAFAVILVGATLYYSWKRRFDALYSLFLSGTVGAMLKYAVSGSLLFADAPPSIKVMMLATLSVFNPPFWLATLVFFLAMAPGSPLQAVSGLLLGYGLGKWHSMKKKRLLLEEGEVKRKVVHIAAIFLIAGTAFVFDWPWVMGLLALIAASVVLVNTVHIPVVSDLFAETKRDTEWLGKGVFWTVAGAVLPVYLGQPWILLVVALGDGLATLIGRFFGYTPLYCSKTLEGTFAGLLAAWSVARQFYSPVAVPVALYLAAELLAPIDDNVAVPAALSLPYLL